MKRALITGGRGLLGKEVAKVFRRRGFEVRETDLSELDVTSPAACREAVSGYLPEVVIHCAAYTAVDRAESEAEAAFAVNEAGTRNVAVACRESGALMVTFGSDYVFDGTLDRPYREDDPVRPLSVYGKSKLAAEEALRESGCDHLLVRTQWLYGPGGKNFIQTILDKARQGATLKVASDQTGCPTLTKDLAEAVLRLVEAGARGTVHFSNEGETTWFYLARFVLKGEEFSSVPLLPAATRDLPYPAPRPAYSVLSKEKYRGITGESPRPWDEAVKEFLSSLPAGRSNA
ncbi:MAG: dTDP-4-dehydrorhamnose reductase [Deltaproteobacteria bacterium]|nr:dTDP-4-dehydrorhamnose reductase [Deltaproteobacteria bacterium]